VLSKQRADAVQKVLAKDLGSGITFEIRGYGEQYPIADNSTEEGRKKTAVSRSPSHAPRALRADINRAGPQFLVRTGPVCLPGSDYSR
jgi:hypothetical protein